MQPGWKTAKFWLGLLAITLGAIVSSGILNDNELALQIAGIVTTVLGTLGYHVSRTVERRALAAPDDSTG